MELSTSAGEADQAIYKVVRSAYEVPVGQDAAAALRFIPATLLFPVDLAGLISRYELARKRPGHDH